MKTQSLADRGLVLNQLFQAGTVLRNTCMKTQSLMAKGVSLGLAISGRYYYEEYLYEKPSHSQMRRRGVTLRLTISDGYCRKSDYCHHGMF